MLDRVFAGELRTAPAPCSLHRKFALSQLIFLPNPSPPKEEREKTTRRKTKRQRQRKI